MSLQSSQDRPLQQQQNRYMCFEDSALKTVISIQTVLIQGEIEKVGINKIENAL